jgi:hypothetical protein
MILIPYRDAETGVANVSIRRYDCVVWLFSDYAHMALAYFARAISVGTKGDPGEEKCPHGGLVYVRRRVKFDGSWHRFSHHNSVSRGVTAPCLTPLISQRQSLY